MQAEPVIAPPAEHAADWAQRKHDEETIERLQLGWLELD
jgi:hypothetical protein